MDDLSLLVNLVKVHFNKMFQVFLKNDLIELLIFYEYLCMHLAYRVAQGPTLWTALRRVDYKATQSTILVKEEPLRRISFITTMSCIVAALAAFWSDLRSLEPKEWFEKAKDKIKDATE